MKQTTHKLLSNAAALCLLFGTTTSVLAQSEFTGNLNTVAISDAEGTNNPPTASFTYTQDGDTFTFDASGSSDSDGAIVEYRWDFGDGVTGTGSTISHQFQNASTQDVTLTLIDNTNGVTIAQKSVSSQPPINIAINFQPSNVEIPAGYLMDSGATYSDTQGYGWTVLPDSLGVRDRNNSLSPDQSYDTLIHLTPTAVWEYKLENGTYNVAVAMGDPSYPDTIQAAQVENQELIPQTTLSQSEPWIEQQTIVTVTDGALTITFNSSSVGKLCWVKIYNN